MNLYEDISFYEVQQGWIVDSDTFTGFILRNESVVNTGQSGYINYFVNDGAMVAREGNVCMVTTNAGSSVQGTADGSALTLNGSDYSDIREQVLSFKKKYNDSDYASVYDLDYQLGNIVSNIVKNVSKPVTVKIRSGFDKEHINAVEVAKLIEKAGASAIAVHGRTRAQMYSGHANLDVIKDVVEAVNIPVVGNGDIVDGPSALHMLEYTGCKAIMIGRGALGNPWIFKEINAYFAGEEFKRPSKEEIYNMIVDQYERLLKLKGERLALLEMRSHVGWYLKGMQGSAQIKNKANQALSFEEVKKILKEYLLA